MDTSDLNVQAKDWAIMYERMELPGEDVPGDRNIGQYNGVDCVALATGYIEAQYDGTDHKWQLVTEATEPEPAKNVTWLFLNPDGDFKHIVQWHRGV